MGDKEKLVKELLKSIFLFCKSIDIDVTTIIESCAEAIEELEEYEYTIEMNRAKEQERLEDEKEREYLPLGANFFEDRMAFDIEERERSCYLNADKGSL